MGLIGVVGYNWHHQIKREEQDTLRRHREALEIEAKKKKEQYQKSAR